MCYIILVCFCIRSTAKAGVNASPLTGGDIKADSPLPQAHGSVLLADLGYHPVGMNV